MNLPGGNTRKEDLLAGLSAADTKTITRLLIDVWVHFPVTNSFQDRANALDVGIGVVSQEAFDLETLPDPDAVGDYPQMGWIYVATQPVLKYVEGTGIGVVIPAHFKADIRGQRKVDRGVLFMLLQNIGVNGNDSVDIWGRVRALCLT